MDLEKVAKRMQEGRKPEDEGKTWYYYLHQNGDLIGKPPQVVSDGYFNSPFVEKVWCLDLTDRRDLYHFLFEALAMGANRERVAELAQEWSCDFEDTVVAAVMLSKDVNDRL